MDDAHCIVDGGTKPTSSMPDENINISDVIEVIETDPDFQPVQTNQPTSNMYGGGAHRTRKTQAFVQIVEQPASKALRFRYECEGRSAGSIPGANSTAENKTYPSIRIVGYQGKAVVVVSCVTKDAPYRPHPHNLVGREGCRKGVCTLEISPETMSMSFSNLGIQCVKKKDIEAHLKTREEIRVDPFKTGFNHRNQPTSIDLNAVRLCFQVFIEGDKGKFTTALPPVVSEPIYDKKAMSDLVIVKLSHTCCTVDGSRTDVILLCEKVAKEDIQVRFFEEKDGVLLWEAFGDFQPSQVHKQTAIWFRTPRYRTLDITEAVRVNIQLRRPSDGATSEALTFDYMPLDAGDKRKRNFESDSGRNLKRPLHEQDQNREPPPFNIMPDELDIKAEPADHSPYPSPHYAGRSPNPSLSPNYFTMGVNLGPAVSPSHDIPYNIAYSPNNLLHPAMNHQPPQLPPINNVLATTAQASANWNIQIDSNDLGATAMEINTPNGTTLLNLDCQTLPPISINSGDLSIYGENLSENLSNNLTISDEPRNENMTDSLTRLMRITYDNTVL